MGRQDKVNAVKVGLRGETIKTEWGSKFYFFLPYPTPEIFFPTRPAPGSFLTYPENHPPG